MGLISVAVYAPKPGREKELLADVADRLPLLRRLGLATDRPEILCRSRGGAIIQISEWSSAEALDRAHGMPEVTAMWERFAACCGFTPLGELPEAGEMFATFEAIDR